MRCLVAFVIFLLTFPTWAGTEWRGFVAAEYRHFPKSGFDSQQRHSYPSIIVHPELLFESEDRRNYLTVAPFARWDRYDDQRTHADLREASWLYVGDGYEALIGVSKVFWGVTEAQHLVDLINQTDLVENPDGEDKLGQPMASLKLFTSLGTWHFFALPYFRERTFPGQAGRLRTRPRVDTKTDALYESARKQSHTDYAVRWTQTIEVLDIGLSHFYGTNRDPVLLPATTAAGEPVLVPRYDLIHQTGLDVQATLTSWLLKLEAIHRTSSTQEYNASTTGFEYTLTGIFDTASDVGILAEYLYDSRGKAAPTPFDDDLMVGLRLRPNDVHGTTLLFTMISDRRTRTRVFNLEGSRRLTDNLKLGLELRLFRNVDASDPLASLSRDDYLQLELGYYF